MSASLSTPLLALPTSHGTAEPQRPAAWRVRLLGAIEAEGRGPGIDRWPTRATAALLARLALEPGRDHPREELIELLWPGVSLEIGRNRLRQALSALRNLLEPRGAHAAPVLHADRTRIRVLPGALDSDVRQFLHALRSGDRAEALALYRGELMPGFYDDWVIDERRRLAGLHEPLAAAPPPPAAAATATAEVAPLPTGMPSYWTRAFGAELTASRLQALVCAQRLVTVHGPGGSGKTRLAVEVAQSLRDGRPWTPQAGGAPGRFDRIAFVPLVDCVDAVQALDALAQALHADGGGALETRLAAALAGRSTLLVLDNLEQLVDAAAGAIGRLLAAVPTLHVLVTSRRLLELDGEHAFALEGLPLPAPRAPLADAATNPAVALFVDRARAARADFRLGPRNVDALVGLVRLLGGMPLAIELAASRVRGVKPQDLLQRLSEDAGTPMLDLLARSTQRASADMRHASMRHVVDWSWRQLDPAQAAMLQALSVFASSASPQAVAAVAGIDLRRTRLRLDELLDASLVQLVDDGSDPEAQTRFVLLQPVREFAAERLPADETRAARQRLREWLLDFARQQAGLARPAAVAPEIMHVHAALASAPGDGAAGTALTLAVALRAYWDSDPPPLSLLLALERALADAGDADEALRCDAHELLCFSRGTAGFTAEAVAHAEAAVALAGDARRRSLALTRRAWALYLSGRFDAGLDAALDEALALAQQAGDVLAEATALRMQSIVACNLRYDYAGAEALSARTQRLWERLGHRPMASLSLLNRAMMWGKTGRGNEVAVPVLMECERTALADGDWTGLMTATRQSGRVYVRMRRWDDAAAAFRRSVRVAWQRHSTQGLAHALLHLPMAMAMCGENEAAARLDGFAVAHWWQLFHGINGIEARELRRTRGLLSLRLGAARAAALRADGRVLGIAAAVALALGVEAA